MSLGHLVGLVGGCNPFFPHDFDTKKCNFCLSEVKLCKKFEHGGQNYKFDSVLVFLLLARLLLILKGYL